MKKHLIMSLALTAWLYVQVDHATAQAAAPEGRTGRHINPKSAEPAPKVTPKRIEMKRTGEKPTPAPRTTPQRLVNKGKAPTNLNDDIFVAAENGDLQRVQDLIRQGTDINSVQARSKTTALLAATRNDKIDVANYLLDNGADPRIHDRGNGSCLQWASHWGRLELAQRLLDAGADVNLLNNESRAPIHYAARRGHLDVVKLLIERGANVNLTSGFGNAPIDLALTNANPEMSELLIASGAKLTDTPENALARITVAAQKNWIPIVKDILDQAKRRPLLVQRLLDAAFDSAIGPRHEELLLFITKQDRSVSPKTENGFSRLFQTCSIGAEELTRELLNQGADATEVMHPSEWTPLHAAIIGGRPTVVNMLLQHGANPNAVDGLGRTPLHIAASEPRLLLIPVLAKGQANPNARDAFGKTPIYYAASNGNRSALEALLKVGAVPDVPDNDGITPYRAAEMNAHFDITPLLPRPQKTETPLPPGFEPLVKAAAKSPSQSGLDTERKKLEPLVREGVPLIHLAVMEQSLPAVKQILSGSSKTVMDRDAYGYLPLHHAAAFPNTDVLNALLDNTKDANDASNIAQWTPLHVAASMGNSAAVRALLEHRVDRDAKDTLGNTPADVARQLGYTETETLIRRGP